MLLRKKNISSRYVLAGGQLSLAGGILLTQFAERLTASDAFAGFLTGLGGVLVGVSLVLNLSGLRKMRCHATDRGEWQ